ncbi:MAG: protein kinase [Woeseiaceae bacterium]|nr:protein kinase [Woeseiaceae bacterium]
MRVFEYHDEDAGPCFGLQYIDGPSIAALAGQPLDLLLRPVGLLADALRYAHGKGVVHRDIKAANVLLDSRGAPYLIDFGVAQAAGAPGRAGGGSRAAASPQQRAGEPSHPADDIYALGVLLHELLFGVPPAGSAVPDETTAGERVPARLCDLLRAMLAPGRDARPAAVEVASALAELGFPAGPAVLPRGSANAAADAEVAVSTVRPQAPNGPGSRQGAVPAAADAAGGAAGVARSWPASPCCSWPSSVCCSYCLTRCVPPPDRPTTRPRPRSRRATRRSPPTPRRLRRRRRPTRTGRLSGSAKTCPPPAAATPHS